MGWFLPIRKHKAAARRVRPATPRSKTWNPNRTLAGLEALAAVGLLIGVLASWRYSQIYFSQYLQARQLPKVGANQIDLAQAPQWMRLNTLEELRMLVARNASSDPLDNVSLERAVEALATNPWVENVVRIQRQAGGRIMVLARYREPVAAVQTPDGLRLVDIKGFCLPGLYAQEQAGQLGFPLITGVAQPARPRGETWREGRVWKGEDLQDGLALIGLLRTEPYYQQVQVFDVGQRDARGRICLVVKTGNSNIVWGLPPGKEQAIEADAAVKKIRLADVYRQRGSLDTGGDLDIYQVDAFSEVPRVHRQLVEEQSLAVGYTWSK